MPVAAQVDSRSGQLAVAGPEAPLRYLVSGGLPVEDPPRGHVAGGGQRPQPRCGGRPRHAQQRLDMIGQDQPVLAQEGQQLPVAVGEMDLPAGALHIAKRGWRARIRPPYACASGPAHFRTTRALQDGWGSDRVSTTSKSRPLRRFSWCS